MRYTGEAVLLGDALLEVAAKTFADFYYRAAFAADEVMVMAVVILAEKFKARSPIAKIKAFHHRHFLQQT